MRTLNKFGKRSIKLVDLTGSKIFDFMIDEVWVFHGAGGKFTSGVFSSKEVAESWIMSRGLEGVLTKYPIDVGVYEWAINNHYFSPQKMEHSTPAFIQKFTSASMEHYHYENDPK